MSLANASLEPAEQAGAPAKPNGGPVFHPNTRSTAKTERRQNTERRVELRFQGERREGRDRRPRKSWELGHNL
jgi:hypothetical protein